MNVIRDNPAAQDLPSRRHFALARLFAFLSFDESRKMPEAIDRLMLPIDCDQSAAEIYTVAVWMFVTAACYFAAILPLPAGWSIAIAIVFTGIVIQFPLYLIGAVLVPLWNLAAGTKIENNQKLNSVAFMTLMVIASSYFGAIDSPARYVAWFFFAVLILNAAAWIVMALLRGKVREMEHRCGL